MDEQKPWRAAVVYRRNLYLVGYFDDEETAKREAAFSAKSHSEDPVHYIEVDEHKGARHRQYWLGRLPRGNWFLC